METEITLFFAKLWGGFFLVFGGGYFYGYGKGFFWRAYRRNGVEAEGREAMGLLCAVRITTQSERTMKYKVTTRAERAKSVALRLVESSDFII